MIEGRVTMLLTGAVSGSLWLLRKETVATQWSDNFRTESVGMILQTPPRDALPGNRLL